MGDGRSKLMTRFWGGFFTSIEGNPLSRCTNQQPASGACERPGVDHRSFSEHTGAFTRPARQAVNALRFIFPNPHISGGVARPESSKGVESMQIPQLRILPVQSTQRNFYTPKGFDSTAQDKRSVVLGMDPIK